LYGWLVAASVIAILATAGLLTNVAQTIAGGFAGSQLDDRIAANNTSLVLGAWRSLLFVALAVGLVLAADRKRIDRRVLAWGLAAVVAADLWSIDRLYWLFSPRASVIYAGDPATEYLRQAPPGRVIAAPLSNEGLVPRDPNFGYDGLMVHRVRLATGYHGNEIGRYRLLGSPDGSDQYQNLLNPAFWRLTNVRYLYTNTDVNQLGITKLLGPVKSAAGSTVYLYRLPGDNPPAWVAPVMVKAGEAATQSTVLDPRFDPLRAAIIDSASSVPGQSISALPQPLAITPKVTRYDAGHIAVELSAPAPAGSALVVSENYYPGWRATVNGVPAPVVRTDFTFLGVPLTAGATRISLDYADPAYRTGKLVTLFAALLAVVLTVVGAIVERRRRAA
jgi:hypothetical protein